MEQYLPLTWHSSTFQTNFNPQIVTCLLTMKRRVYEILCMKYLKKKKKKRYSFSYLKTTSVILILMRIYRTYSKFNFCVPSLFLQGGRIQIFVIIFRRLRFVESKVMRPVEFRMLWYTWKDIYCEEQLKKKEEKGSKKKIRNWNEWICTENFYPHSKFIYARHFERSESFFFWNFFKKSRNKRNNTNFIIYGSNNLTCNLILLYDYYAPPPRGKYKFRRIIKHMIKSE